MNGEPLSEECSATRNWGVRVKVRVKERERVSGRECESASEKKKRM